MAKTKVSGRALGLAAVLAGLLLVAHGTGRAQEEGSGEEESGEGTDVELVSEGKVTETATETTESSPEAESVTVETWEGEEEGEEVEVKEATTKKTVSFEIPLKVDGLYTYMSDIQVSDISLDRPEDEILFGNNLGMNSIGGARFRLTPQFKYKDVLSIVAQGDLLLYPFGDEPEGVERSSDIRTHFGDNRDWRSWFNPRHLYLEALLPFGLLRAGQMGSMWGMGMLANDGDQDPVFGTVFGGDIVERVLFATKPFYKLNNEYIKDFVLAIAGDLVFDDITAKLYKGDLAWQAVVALRWSWKKQSAGFYFVYRNQTKKDDRKLEIYAIDFTAHLAMDFIHNLEGYVEAETVYITGETTLARSILYPGGHDVSQFGIVGRLGLKWLETINFWLELGYASGDSNAYDDSIKQLTMDPSRKVGLILFPEVLAWQSARGAVLAGHDEITGQDNPGIELLPSNGGVSGSFYFNPVLRAKPLKWLEANVGLVVARASTYLISAWEQKSHGAPAGYLGGSASQTNLGVELDGSLWFHIPVKYVGLSAGVEAGYFWPGKYFSDSAGNTMDDVWLISTRIKLTY